MNKHWKPDILFWNKIREREEKNCINEWMEDSNNKKWPKKQNKKLTNDQETSKND